MKFSLTIELGNDEMHTPQHVAHALRGIAKRIDPYTDWRSFDQERVKDANGNSCGTWTIDKATPELLRDGYMLEELEARPTLAESHTANLKIDTGKARVWLSRVGIEDGEEYDNAVIVERLRDGGWTEVERYQAL